MEERIITYRNIFGDSIEIPEETIHEFHSTPDDEKESFIDEIYPNFAAQVLTMQIPEEWENDEKGYFHSIIGEIEANPEDYDIEFTDDDYDFDKELESLSRQVSEVSFEEFENIMEENNVDYYSSYEHMYAAALYFEATLDECINGDLEEESDNKFSYFNKYIHVINGNANDWLEENYPNYTNDYWDDTIENFKRELENDYLWNYIDEDKLIENMERDNGNIAFEIALGEESDDYEVNGVTYTVYALEY